MNQPADRQVSPACVLVVDDQPDVLTTTVLLLKALGCSNVHAAATGQEALDMARELRPDLVLLDIGLPDIDGFTVSRRMRDELGLDRTAIMGISGYDEDPARTRAAGLNRHLVKPVPLSVLREVIGRSSAECGTRS